MKTLTLPELPTASAARVPEFTFGDRLRKAREVAGLDRDDISRVLGIHRQSVSRYETDRSTPSAAVVVLWSYVTNCDLIWINTGQCTPRDSNSEPTGFESKTVERHAQRSARDVRGTLQETTVISDGAPRVANIRRKAVDK